MKRIGFIGAGNMAEAIIKGLVQKESYEIRVTNRSNRSKLEKMQEEYEAIPSSLEDTIKNSEIVLIAVKPKDMNQALKNIGDFLASEKLVISVAAGIPLKLLEKHFPQNPIVRAMPNTSSAVLSSMTGLVKGKKVGAGEEKIAEEIFTSVGKCLWLPEDEINALTAISGSGPAYFYLFTELLAKAGCELGLCKENAETLAKETIIGAAQMLSQRDESPSQLREAVTSPKGTTEAALNIFWEKGLEKIVSDAVKASKDRAEEMEREFCSD
ncbi:MAG: pyrroline-5-carboxylate reductase [Desulfitobacterium sp.]|nr:pyrroline-5-carboxylate reductase [Desulfitobacterium sp.]